MIKYVILDAGGVLCYPRMGSWLTTNRFEEVLGQRYKQVPPKELALAMEAEAKIYLDESLKIDDETMEFVVRRNYFEALSKRLKWELTDRELNVLARDMTEYDERYAFYDDTRTGLDTLSDKYTLGLLSDAMPSLKRVFMNAGLLEMFLDVVISAEIGATKPDKRMYEAITEKLEAKPEECIFIDDRECNIQGAIDCGMQGLLMDREGVKENSVKDLFEAYRYIEKLNRGE